ncbi:phosphoglycolate phosphatase [soil metagenome]
MPSPIVVFDLDGTLVDAFTDIANAVNAPLAKRGLPTHSVAAITRLVGEGAGRLLDRALPTEDAAEFAAMRAEMMEHYRAHPADFASVYTGILPLLERIRARGFRTAVLSNKPHAMSESTCREMGLSELIECVIGENSPSVPRKPDPTGLRLIIEKLGGGPAVLVGDGLPDGQVAAAAGIPFVACLWGTRSREELVDQNPVAIAEAPDELEGILVEVLGMGNGE